jgi:hypothetical protein
MLAPAAITPTPVIADVPEAIIRPAHGGAVVFSAHTPAPSGGDGRYRLSIRHRDGSVQTFPIRSRGIPFDVDTGPDAHGREVAVYSRCPSERWSVAPGDITPYYRAYSRCRLYELSLATGRERRLHTPTEASGSDYLPTIWRRRLAWVHVEGNSRLSLMVREGNRTRRVRAGTPSRGGPPASYLPAAGVLGLDLRGNHMSMVWSHYDPCATDEPRFGRDPVYEVWSYRLGVTRRRVARANCAHDAMIHLGWAQLTPSGLSYLAQIDNADVLVGPAGRTTITPPQSDFAATFARLDDGRLAVAYDGDSSGIAVAPARRG